MQIKKYDFVTGAKAAKGITVIIDVFRAFSVACYCFSKGASKVIPVAKIDEALSLSSEHNAILRIGERNGKKLPGFDLGNSPTEIDTIDLHNKIIVHTTHAGTQGLVNACNATEVLTGALVNAEATARYIKKQNPTHVSLVRMGFEAGESTDEDNLCAEYLESLLLDKPFAVSAIRKTLQNSPCAERFFDPKMPWSPISDFNFCTEVNRFNFVLKLVKNKERAYLKQLVA